MTWHRLDWTADEASYFDEFRRCSDEAALIAAAIDEVVGQSVGRPLRILDFGGGSGEVSRRMTVPTASIVTVEPLGPDDRYRVVVEIPGTAPVVYSQPLDEALGVLAPFDLCLFCHVLGYLEDPRDILVRLARFVRPGAYWIAVLTAPEGDQYLLTNEAHVRGLSDRPAEYTGMFGKILADAGIPYQNRPVTTGTTVRDLAQARRTVGFFLGLNEHDARVVRATGPVADRSYPTVISSVHSLMVWQGVFPDLGRLDV